MTSRRQLLNDAARQLLAAGASDARIDAEWMLAHVLGHSRLMLLTDPDAPVDTEEAARFRGMTARRAGGLPLQYLLGEADFMGRTFQVDERVLIPRPDTETLCELSIARLQAGMRALDVGTGSGALAVSLALAIPGALVTAVDISADALAVAAENSLRLGASVRFVQSDLFAALPGEVFDLVVSNPPYIPSGALAGLQREVRQEPRLALDGGADGLSYYRRIVQALPGHLIPGGTLLLEVGDGQADAVAAMLHTIFARTYIAPDLAGLARVVIGDGYAG